MADQPATLGSRFEVNWTSMRMANLMKLDDCNAIQAFAKMTEDEIQDRLQRDPDAAAEVAHALVELVKVTGIEQGVGLACSLSAIVLAGGRDRVKLFLDENGTLPVQDYARALSGDTAPGVQVQAGHVIASFLSGGTTAQTAHFSPETLLSWLNGMIQIGSAISERNLIGLKTAAALFRSRDLRLRFIASPGVQTLCEYLARGASDGVTQEIRYRASFCIWTLSYHDEAIPALCAGNATVQLVKQNLTHVDDKISRLALSTLVNFLNKEDAEQGVALNEVMAEANIMKSLLELSLRKWTAKDKKDVEADIAKLNKTLGTRFSAMNSFERYMAELLTGALKEGPMHTDKFWSESASKFEHKDFLPIRLLVDLLSSEDTTTVVLAIRDLGEFARFYEGGKKIIQHYKGKSKIMALMGSKEPAVQKAALISSAKLLINNWEHV